MRIHIIWALYPDCLRSSSVSSRLYELLYCVLLTSLITQYNLLRLDIIYTTMRLTARKTRKILLRIPIRVAMRLQRSLLWFLYTMPVGLYLPTAYGMFVPVFDRRTNGFLLRTACPYYVLRRSQSIGGVKDTEHGRRGDTCRLNQGSPRLRDHLSY